MKSLWFFVLVVLVNLSDSITCIHGQVVYPTQLSQPHIHSGYGGVAPLGYTYNADSAGIVLSPQLNPTPPFHHSHRVAVFPSSPQYQLYPYTQANSQQLLYSSNGLAANGYPYPLLSSVPVTKEVVYEQPLTTTSLVMSQGQGYGGVISPISNPAMGPVYSTFPVRSTSTSQVELLNPPPAQPGLQPVLVVEDDDDVEEEEEEHFDEVLSALIEEAQKNGQTVHSDRYTYGRSVLMPYQLVATPMLMRAKSSSAPFRRYLGRGLTKQMQRDRPQNTIKKPFRVKLPHHFEFYDWH